MNSNFIYVPILKWKQGEREALKNLTNEQKNRITPLIEITDYEEPEKIINKLINCYTGPVYLDTIIAAEDDRDFLLSLVEEGRSKGVSTYPVCYFDDLIDTLTRLPSNINRIAVKIPIPEDIDGPSYENIFFLLKKYTVEKNILMDLIVDLDSITDKTNANRQLRDLKEVINNHLLEDLFYNLLIISSTSFPQNLSNIPAGGIANYIRYDIKIYNKIIADSKFASIKEKITYSDYGVTRFTDSDIDFSKLRYGVLPKIKYTVDDSYIVLKGQRNQATREIIKSYIDLSKETLESDYYYGEKFSFGDLEIKERALSLNKKGPGSNTNWVTISANHHIAVVIEQLSTLL